MRCRDVSRALTDPERAMVTAELAAHLDACPRCARRARAALRLDRAWEATRPAPPSPAAWEAAWVRIDRELAAASPAAEVSGTEGTTSLNRSAGRWSKRLVGGLALAAAAAALLVVLVRPEPSPTTAEAAPIRGELVVEVGHTVLFHVDSGETQVIQVNDPTTEGEVEADVDLTFFGRSGAGVDDVDYFALFGWFEAIPALMASAEEPPSPFSQRAQ